MQKRIRVGINIFWFLIIAYLSYKMPLFMDDHFQSKSFANGEPISSVGMIFDSLKVSYQVFNGRVFTMFFIQLMLFLPRAVFAVCNAFVYILLANLIVEYVKTGFNYIEDGFGLLSLTYICMWFMMPDFAEVVVWPSGCITYMWMNLIILSFGFVYYKDFMSKRNGMKIATELPIFKKMLLVIGYVLFGLVAGWSAEASAGAMIFGILLFLIWSAFTKNKIGLEKIFGFISCFIGYCMLVFAPANRVRVSDAENTSAARGLFATLGYRFARESYYLFILLLVPIAISVALYLLSKCKNEKQITRNNVVIFFGKELAKGGEAFFWLLAFTSVYVMTFSAGFANRIFQFPLFMLIIAMGKSFETIRSKVSEKIRLVLNRSIIAFCVIMMLLALTEVVAGSMYSKTHNSFFDRQMIYYNIYDTQGIISTDNDN
jgi:hypothetical protein